MFVSLSLSFRCTYYNTPVRICQYFLAKNFFLFFFKNLLTNRLCCGILLSTGEGNTPSRETKRAGKIDEAPSSHDHGERVVLARLARYASRRDVQIVPLAYVVTERVSLTRDSE